VLVWALEEFLGELGCKVVGSAARVTDAMAFVAQHTFDVAVLDGTLSDGDIDPVVELLMARGVPFILSSGRSSYDVTKKYGHAVVLQKPYKDSELQQALLLALARGSSERKPVL
jgi:AmiR/NasT family two-component response regulator